MIQPVLPAETPGAMVLMHAAPLRLDNVIPGPAYFSARSTRQWYAASSHPWDFHRTWHTDLTS